MRTTIQMLQESYDYKSNLIKNLKDKKSIERHERDLVEIGARIELLSE